MTTYPESLRTHLARDCTTVCHAWRLTRRDGEASGYTDHDVPLAFDNTLFEPATGFTGSEAKTSLGLAIDTVDVEGALSSAGLVDEEIEAGLLDDATVETFLVNWRMPGEFALIRRATIGRITRSDGRFVAELKSRMHALDQPNARYLTRACDAELGDQRCGFDLGQAGFRGAGAVFDKIAPDAWLVAGLAGFAADWFTDGVLTWTSGARSGRSDRVVDHRTQGEQALMFLLPVEGGEATVGDTFNVVAGCDKTFAACRAKFANRDNFRGFPHLPGNDSAYAYVTDGLVFDGGPLVP
ncbi:DUF2163 domain-containing protein [Arvimicrobium flavum]|uniref:DUF2163 domain-containing protein n=1 Tax=Arvimicrobium flavum TaxID=3393320 RepID=UPI00237BE2CE|nr:DUF2163 domain-containing protein [Mesorhizobium shangrilense]